MSAQRKRRETFHFRSGAGGPAGDPPIGKFLIALALVGVFIYILWRLMSGAVSPAGSGKTDPGQPVARSLEAGPTVRITGTVLNENSDPIPNVKVSLLDNAAMTNQNGDFVLEVLQSDAAADISVDHPVFGSPVRRRVKLDGRAPQDLIFVFTVTGSSLSQQQPQTTGTPATRALDPVTTTSPVLTPPATASSNSGDKVLVDAGWEVLLQRDREFQAQGLRMQDVEVYKSGTGPVYSAVWQNGQTESLLWHAAGWEAFRSKRNELRSQGYRITDIEVDGDAAGLEFAGIWVRDQTDHKLWVGISWAEFLQKSVAYEKEKYYLIDVEGYQEKGQPRYAGIWRAGGGGGDKIWKTSNKNSFIAQHRKYLAEGRYMCDLEIVTENGAAQYIGVWLGGSAQNKLWLQDQQAGFQQKISEFALERFSLIDLEITRSGSRREFSGIWSNNAAATGLPVSRKIDPPANTPASGIKVLEE